MVEIGESTMFSNDEAIIPNVVSGDNSPQLQTAEKLPSSLLDKFCDSVSKLPIEYRTWMMSALTALMLVTAPDSASASVKHYNAETYSRAANAGFLLAANNEENNSQEHSSETETLDLGYIKTRFLIDNPEGEVGYSLINPEEVNLSEDDKVILESAKGVLPLATSKGNENGHWYSTMVMLDSEEIGPGISKYQALSSAHQFQSLYLYSQNENSLAGEFKVRVEGSKEHRATPAAFKFPNNYDTNNLDTEPYDSALIEFIDDNKFDFSKAEYVTQREITENPTALEGLEVYITGFPRNIDTGLTRVIFKGKIVGMDYANGLVSNLYLDIGAGLDDAVPSFGGISGGKASVVIGGVEYIIGTYRGYSDLKDENRESTYLSVITTIQSSYIDSSVKSPLVPTLDPDFPLVIGEISFEELKSYVYRAPELDFDTKTGLISRIHYLNPEKIESDGNGVFKVFTRGESGELIENGFSLNVEYLASAIEPQS